MSAIQAIEKTVSELLRNVKYDIDFYQREYEWQRRQVEELLVDFEARFLSSYSPDDERTKVTNYSHYFLGTIITVADNGQSFIVDGQQRLTTLTLLLIFIQHRLKDTDDRNNCSLLIHSSKSGVKSFNINVRERLDCMRGLFERDSFNADDQSDLSVKNLVARYEDIKEVFPDSLKGETLTYFFDWLTDCVDLVEIKAYTDDDAFTIFETMNDRGLNLGQADMLKGYLLANINNSEQQWTHDNKSQANDTWKKRIREFVEIENGEEDSFFKAWLRAKYAQSIRERKKGATNRDFENINKFHRWVRDNKDQIGLHKTQDFSDFIMQHMNRFAGHYVTIRNAECALTPGLEAVYYNSHNNFTLQSMLMLAPIRRCDDESTALRKIRLVATFADIYLARRMVNYKSIGRTTLGYAMFNLVKAIRNRNVEELRSHLRDQLYIMGETFSALDKFYLHGRNNNHTRYLLARMTAWTERETGNNVNFRNFLWDAKGRPLEIEHIWADKYERHENEYSHENDFQRERNYVGDLVLLRRGTNQSYSALPYEEKVEHYVKENLLAASLHPRTYKNNPNFTNFVKRSGLPFKPHTEFKRADLLERQELYRQICERIWDPKRLNAI